jgi:pimeloyl-ACP methyl ester carboxylesterase
MGSIPKQLKKAGCTVIPLNIDNYSALTNPRVSPIGKPGAPWSRAVARLKEEFSTVSLCGLSMGATLALAVAARSKDLLSVVLLSPVLQYDGWSVPWYWKLLTVVYDLGIRNWSYKESEPYGIKNYEMRRRVAAALEKDGVAAVGAASIPARHLRAALRMIAFVRKSLPLVRTDTLIIHSIDDETASRAMPSDPAAHQCRGAQGDLAGRLLSHHHGGQRARDRHQRNRDVHQAQHRDPRQRDEPQIPGPFLAAEGSTDAAEQTQPADKRR